MLGREQRREEERNGQGEGQREEDKPKKGRYVCHILKEREH